MLFMLITICILILTTIIMIFINYHNSIHSKNLCTEQGYYSDDTDSDVSFNNDLDNIVFDKVRSSIRMAQGKVVTTSDFNRLKNKIDTMEMPKGN